MVHECDGLREINVPEDPSTRVQICTSWDEGQEEWEFSFCHTEGGAGRAQHLSITFPISFCPFCGEKLLEP